MCLVFFFSQRLRLNTERRAARDREALNSRQLNSVLGCISHAERFIKCSAAAEGHQNIFLCANLREKYTALHGSSRENKNVELCINWSVAAMLTTRNGID